MTKTSEMKETFKTLLTRELVLEPRLAEEFGLNELLQAPASDGDANGQPVLQALDRGESITELGLEKALKEELKRNKLFAFTKPTAEKVESIEEDAEKYQVYCQLAACDGVGRAPARAARLLEEAGTIEDGWARHHHLQGLIQGLRKNYESAREELEVAMENEPFQNGKVRIEQALRYCEEFVQQEA